MKHTKVWRLRSRKKNVSDPINNFSIDYIDRLADVENSIKVTFTSFFLLL